MTARISKAAVLVLAGEESNIRVSKAAVLVLWGTLSKAQFSKAAVLVLGRRHGRRMIGITD